MVSTSSAAEGDSEAAPRRRYLTLLFSDLSSSTKIADLLETEDYDDLLSGIRAAYNRVISRHEGAVAQISGDGMLAVFGHEETREGDSRRAVDAALELHAAIRALGTTPRWHNIPLYLHTGIHSGLVLLREGDAVRGRFDVPGPATNIAARLCGEAGADQILVSEATLGPERHLFNFSEMSLLLKGRDVPVATLLISGRTPLHGRYAASVRGGLTPFIGRETELNAIAESLGAAMEGGVRILALQGPAGVGKTRLADTFLRDASARGFEVLRGECDSGAEPLRPFLQIARGANAGVRPGVVQTGADITSGEKDANSRDQIEMMIATAARRVRLILFIDDWQFADDASREMLAALNGREGCSLFILLTARTPPALALHSGGYTAIDLPPFGEVETAKAVECLLPVVDPFVVGTISSSSGGNPLFIEELCHSIASGQQHGGEPVPTSPWLDTLIESRFARLARVQAGLLRAAAVIGNTVPSGLLTHVTGFAESDSIFAALAEEDFLFAGERPGTVRFKHGITREVIYQAIGLRERRALHLRIASTIRDYGMESDGKEALEALAYHYEGACEYAETARYAELAGDKAMAVSALDRAQAHYRAALAALERLPASDEVNLRWNRIAQRLGRAGVFDPSRDQLVIFERALERAEAQRDEVARAWAHYWLGYINYGLGEPVAAARHCARALNVALAVKDDRFAVQIRATLGQAKAAACDYAGGLALLDQAIEIQRRNGSGARPSASYGYSLSVRAFALGDMGRFDEARACFDEAMEAVRGAPREVAVSVLNQYAVTCLWQGCLDDALRLANEGAKVAEYVHSRYSHAMSRSIAAFARWSIDSDPAAIQILVEATSWLDASGRGQYTSLNHGWLTQVMIADGRFSAARGYAARALLRARKRDRLGEAMALRGMARIAAQVGGARTPAQYLDRALKSAAVRNSAHEVSATLLCRAELLRQVHEQTSSGTYPWTFGPPAQFGQPA